ncbi:Cytosolic carboxypeptidase 3 [Manis javanica]|nr:Cytosolic carboxypeptidase 3 [Manis javanica]
MAQSCAHDQENEKFWRLHLQWKKNLSQAEMEAPVWTVRMWQARLSKEQSLLHLRLHEQADGIHLGI